jgi:hypothetical protein
MSTIAWLPELVLLSDSGHDWGVYLDVVYLMFRRDFLDSLPMFQGQPMRIKREPLKDGREATFWHLITEGEVEAQRNPDEIRCERIRWPRPVIQRCPCTELRIWRSMRQGEKRTVIALQDFSYVVVLAERKGYYLPWTAYPVEREHRRRKLRKEHDEYTNNSGVAI